MASAIEEIAKRNRAKISAANANRARNWGWDKSVSCYTHDMSPSGDIDAGRSRALTR
jgi:hypothetical protein